MVFQRLRTTRQRLGRAALRFRFARSPRFAITPRTLNVLDPHTNRFLRMTSSWVQMWRYDQDRQIMTLFTKDGGRYDYPDIPPDVADAILQAQAKCVTRDSGDKVEWWKGKTPSWGAAYHHILLPFLQRGTRP